MHGDDQVQKPMMFPRNFLWGASTAAYQIEGATREAGRGPSIWDTFSTIPGKVLGDDTGEPACDHFNRWAQDIALLEELGLPCYRFSIAWPRVQPDGIRVEPRGLGFYDRLVDSIIEHGIIPMVTLYHWDLPQALQERGGWPERDTTARFADYAELVFERLADRVSYWTTVNEPLCSAFFGYGTGVHAPGIQDNRQALQAAHHLLLGHGLALRRMREVGVAGEHQIGITLNFAPTVVDRADEAHLQAGRRVDAMHNRFFLDPITGHGYPEEMRDDSANLDALQTVIRDGDLDTVSTPLDWLGVNYYAPIRPAPREETDTGIGLPGLDDIGILPPRGKLTSMGWEQSPADLSRLLLRLAEQCRDLPLIVSENGAAFPDSVAANGRVHDVERTRYYTDHLAAVHAAIQAGADVRGYLAWSLLDNFEWAMGYSQRFGLIHVDFETQQRRVKDSGRLLAEIIRTNSI